MSLKPEEIESYQRKVDEQKKAFELTFKTINGQTVLKALREEFYDCPILPGDDMSFKAGQRDVIYQILDRLGEL